MGRLKALITWDLDEKLYSELQKEFRNIEFEKCLEEKEILAKVVDMDIVYAGVFSREHFLKATRLKWMQLNRHGANAYLFPEMIHSKVLLTNSGQVFSIPISEHVFALMLSHSRKIFELREGQLRGKWLNNEMRPYLSELYGKVICLVGVGNIGKEVAKRAKAFGMKVIGIRKNSQIPNQYVNQMYSMKDIEYVFGIADYVVITLPGTRDTTGLIGKKELLYLKKDAYLINVGRGSVIIEEDLIAYLKANQSAGAGLDVFTTEPLPGESQFYSMKNVTLTPHIAHASPAAALRQVAIFKENLKRYLSNKPLENLVNKQEGY